MSSSLITPLHQLPLGARGEVREVEGSDEVWLRLLEMGILPGTVVAVVKRAPLGDPLELRVRDQHLSLRRGEASRVQVTALTSGVTRD